MLTLQNMLPRPTNLANSSVQGTLGETKKIHSKDIMAVPCEPFHRDIISFRDDLNDRLRNYDFQNRSDSGVDATPPRLCITALPSASVIELSEKVRTRIQPNTSPRGQVGLVPLMKLQQHPTICSTVDVALSAVSQETTHQGCCAGLR
jgi:hypothetical protein